MSVSFLSPVALLFVGVCATAQTTDLPLRAPSPADDAGRTAQLSSAAVLTLDDVLGIAAQANPVLRGAAADAEASVGALLQAGARPNPELSLLQEGFGRLERTSTATVSQLLELGGKRRARLTVASYGREVALASLDAESAALRARVIAAFYELLAAQRQAQVAQESAEIAGRSAELADKRARAGKASPVEATKARVAASGAQIEAAAARSRMAVAGEKLTSVSGSSAVRGLTVAGDMETLPDVEPMSTLLVRLPDAPLARAAKAEAMRAEAAVSVERARRMPDITVSAGMKRVVTGGAPDNQVVVGVSIPLPIFDTNRGGVMEATHRATRAAADADAGRASLQLQLAQWHANYRSAQQEATRLKSDMLPAARQALDAVTRGYELGKFGLLDVLDAQRTLFQGESRYVQSLADAHLAAAEIGRLIGTPLPTLAGAIPVPLSTQHSQR